MSTSQGRRGAVRAQALLLYCSGARMPQEDGLVSFGCKISMGREYKCQVGCNLHAQRLCPWIYILAIEFTYSSHSPEFSLTLYSLALSLSLTPTARLLQVLPLFRPAQLFTTLVDRRNANDKSALKCPESSRGPRDHRRLSGLRGDTECRSTIYDHVSAMCVIKRIGRPYRFLPVAFNLSKLKCSTNRALNIANTCPNALYHIVRFATL